MTVSTYNIDYYFHCLYLPYRDIPEKSERSKLFQTLSPKRIPQKLNIELNQYLTVNS